MGGSKYLSREGHLKKWMMFYDCVAKLWISHGSLFSAGDLWSGLHRVRARNAARLTFRRQDGKNGKRKQHTNETPPKVRRATCSARAMTLAYRSFWISQILRGLPQCDIQRRTLQFVGLPAFRHNSRQILLAPPCSRYIHIHT